MFIKTKVFVEKLVAMVLKIGAPFLEAPSIINENAKNVPFHCVEHFYFKYIVVHKNNKDDSLSPVYVLSFKLCFHWQKLAQ